MPFGVRLGRKRLENGKLPKLRTAPKNAPSPSRPVHLGMMAGDHFPPKNVLVSMQDEGKSGVF
jgi:hypothetical protein